MSTRAHLLVSLLVLNDSGDGNDLFVKGTRSLGLSGTLLGASSKCVWCVSVTSWVRPLTQTSKHNYNTTMNSNHELVPWAAREMLYLAATFSDVIPIGVKQSAASLLLVKPAFNLPTPSIIPAEDMLSTPAAIPTWKGQNQ